MNEYPVISYPLLLIIWNQNWILPLELYTCEEKQADSPNICWPFAAATWTGTTEDIWLLLFTANLVLMKETSLPVSTKATVLNLPIWRFNVNALEVGAVPRTQGMHWNLNHRCLLTEHQRIFPLFRLVTILYYSHFFPFLILYHYHRINLFCLTNISMARYPRFCTLKHLPASLSSAKCSFSLLWPPCPCYFLSKFYLVFVQK